MAASNLSASTSTTDRNGVHVVFLQHGLHGSHRDWDNFVARARKTVATLKDASGNQIAFHPIVANSGLTPTMKGVEYNAHGAVSEIRATLTKFSDKGTPVAKISVVGHSFGGLIVRFIAALLFKEKIIGRADDESENTSQIRAGILATIASPNLGVRRPQRSIFNKLFHVGAPILAGRSGSELLLRDDSEPSEVFHPNHNQDSKTEAADSHQSSAPAQSPESSEAPELPNSSEASKIPGFSHLLVRMTTGIFLDALAVFEERLAYGNVFGDLLVPHTTATIRRFNPYRALSNEDIKVRHPFSHILDEKASCRPQTLQESTLPTESIAVSDTAPREGFSSDEKQTVLLGMQERLQKVGWTRVDVWIRRSFLNVHDLIVMNSRISSKSPDTCDHLCQVLTNCVSK